ncbi:hypothetical protein F5Y16DRAFT_386597 [Xylariaceae sp. FL0255]|nr:hypothetical protein F5Y16DRAFT_386597 [Xylariaceae sp. FL0255]
MKSLLNLLPSHKATRDSKYAELLQDDQSNDEEPITNDTGLLVLLRRHLKTMLMLWAIMLCSSLAVLVLMSFVFLKNTVPSKPEMPTWTACGHTPEEAKSQGCLFEPLMSAWVPKECSSQEVIDEFSEVMTTFRWFRDDQLAEQITDPFEIQQIRSGNYSKLYTNGVGHHIHCLYTWRKLRFALEANWTLIDARTYQLTHSKHCALGITTSLQKLAGLLPEEPILLKGRVKYPMIFHTCTPLPHVNI